MQAGALDAFVVAYERANAAFTVEGPCLTCGHRFSQTLPTEIAPTVASGVAVPPEERTTRKIRCSCLENHGGPTGGGCGRWWLAAVIETPDASWSLSADVDFDLVPALDTLDKVLETDLSSVRGVAEKWLPGLAAIYGLFGLAGLIFAKDVIDSVPVAGRVSFALAAAFGAFHALLAILHGYEAAFGFVTVVDVGTDAELTAWFQNRRQAASGVASALRTAVDSAVTALAALLLAVGILWLWPAAETAVESVAIDYLQDGDASTPASVCGELLPGSDHMIRLTIVDGSTRRTLTIMPGWVTGLGAVEDCD